MPYKNREKQRESDKNYKRRVQGYKRGNRPNIYATISSANLETLTDQERQIIDLYYRDGCTLAAIAKKFNCTRQAIGLRKNKIAKKLGI